MSLFDANSNAQAISPGDLSMPTETLNVWCVQRKIQRRDATLQAKILLDSYRKGRRSQVNLIDDLMKSEH